MSTIEFPKEPITLGLHLARPTRRWTATEVSMFRRLLLNAFEPRSILDPSELAKTPPLSAAWLRGQLFLMAKVSDLAGALDVLAVELNALDLYEAASIGWFCSDEGYWRDAHPKCPTTPFEHRVDAFLKWNVEYEKQSAAAAIFLEYLKPFQASLKPLDPPIQ